jgi:hypothetical protein
LQLLARPLAVFSAFVFCLAVAFSAPVSARASALEPLSEADARFYRAAFAAADHGDFDAAEAAQANARDKSLRGPLDFARIMHPTAHAASYDELTGWLASYGDQAGAERVYALAVKRKPARAAAPKIPALFVTGAKDPAPTDKARAAREAYYSGDVKRPWPWPRPRASPGSPASPPSACRPTPRPGPISSASPTTRARTNGCARRPPSGPRARRPRAGSPATSRTCSAWPPARPTPSTA